MVAIEPELREKYVETIDHVLVPGGKILLVTFEYDQVRVHIIHLHVMCVFLYDAMSCIDRNLYLQVFVWR